MKENTTLLMYFFLFFKDIFNYLLIVSGASKHTMLI